MRLVGRRDAMESYNPLHFSLSLCHLHCHGLAMACLHVPSLKKSFGPSLLAAYACAAEDSVSNPRGPSCKVELALAHTFASVAARQHMLRGMAHLLHNRGGDVVARGWVLASLLHAWYTCPTGA